ncbi:NAD-dependent epimerase/dehydratase family protein [Desertibaculum subflavum]|uniref:NAD-dependent epimerase/dehydratase family protein n=1 Tax=Desertibaculum subflavum TaxID=2268458 RepID=UPI000E660D7B
MASIVVTGGSGKAGRAVIRDLLDYGHKVVNVDIAPPREPLCHYLKADLTDLGQAIDALGLLPGSVDRRRTGFGPTDAVIHLAGIPAPGIAPDATIFQNNLISTYNVFSAALRLGIRRVVWASSETVLGLPLTRSPPAYAPIDEAHPLRPETGYALAKLLCEQAAREMHRWQPGVSFVGLRISNIFEPEDYAMIPGFQAEPASRAWNLWSWVDARDVAQACRLAVEQSIAGAENFIIAAADTVMATPSRDLMARHYPGVPVREDLGPFDTLLGIDKARRELGYRPRHSWRSAV